MRYTINTQISRPDSALVNRFAHLAVPDICDALGRNAALPSSIRPLNCTRILGIAYTVNLPASENLLLYYASVKAQPGDVIVASFAGYS